MPLYRLLIFINSHYGTVKCSLGQCSTQGSTFFVFTLWYSRDCLVGVIVTTSINLIYHKDVRRQVDPKWYQLKCQKCYHAKIEKRHIKFGCVVSTHKIKLTCHLKCMLNAVNTKKNKKNCCTLVTYPSQIWNKK